MANEQLQLKSKVGEQVISRINALCEAGFTMPKDFSYVNAIKMSMLKLQDVKDRNGKPALEVCTPNSIQTALFKMVTKGLNAALSQGYSIVRGDQLCFDESYFGKILMVKRIYPDFEAVPMVIREGDVFEYGIRPENGKKYVIKHEQQLENIDKPFVGAYMYLPNGELYVMTKKQIMTAWSKSANKSLTTHKEFDEKMIGKTIINSGLNKVINGTPEYNVDDVEQELKDDEKTAIEQHNEYTEFEEVTEEQQTTANDVQQKPTENESNAKEVTQGDLDF